MLWKAVLQGSQTNITYFVCEFRDEIYLPAIAEGDPATADLLDVTQCQSTGQDVLYRGMGCHKQHLSCTPFCNCHCGQDLLNPFTAIRKIAQSTEEETTENKKQITLTATFQMIRIMPKRRLKQITLKATFQMILILS